MATRKFKLNNTRVTKDNIRYKMRPVTEAETASNSTNTRSFTSAVTYNAYKTIDDKANMMRGKINDFLSDLLGTEIDEFCGFNDKNERYMKRLMLLNVSEHEITMDSLGTNAALLGDGTKITNMAQSPSYASDINYTDNFARQIDSDEKHGKNTTRYSQNDYSGNYVNHNQVYSKTTNVYYDDNDTGTFALIDYSNQNSVLYKTKALFNAAKMNTIISRFHTDGGCRSGNGNENVSGIGDAKSIFGKSHGRNLLLKSAEDGNGNGYSINGYNNPYCRVWTHHYQYDKLFKRIRPFYTLDNDGSFKKVPSLKDFHNWNSFGHEKNTNVTNSIKDAKKRWSWKSDDTKSLWNKSVLKSNGFVNITPKYNGGRALNVHTKECMFSIENLAWKGYDPYSFEQALSWEQRGPNGGRIMWFPPYGIEFNETTNVNWVEHQFIGRGESIYTYANTSRTGTLSFMLIVDHPSVIDYVQWHGGKKENETVKDTDLLRFFAGCDSVDSENPNSLLSYVKPTPLTDEYVQDSPIEGNISVEAKIQKSENNDATEELKLSFYVFFPNNYSGTYDKMGCDVEAIAYLLAGNGAQKKNDNNGKLTKDDPLRMEDLSIESNFKQGYESLPSSTSITDEQNHNHICGTTSSWTELISKGIQSYPASDKKWYYRIDGEYEIPLISSEDIYRNKYDQTLEYETNYEDRNNYNLNSNCELVKEYMSPSSDEILFSLAEVAAALEDDATSKNIITKCGIEEERVDKLTKYFSTYKIKSINGIGYSNSHDKNNTKIGNEKETVSQKRNTLLAIQRCETVFDWLKSYDEIVKSEVTYEKISEPSKEINVTNVSDIEAKKWRSAKITILLKRDDTATVPESNSRENVKYVGFDRRNEGNNVYYVDGQGNKWILSKNGNTFTRKTIVGYGIGGRSVDIEQDVWTEVDKSEAQSTNVEMNNNIRYDQEYRFFKQIKDTDPMVWDSLMKKIQYFDPAFHSSSPESFNARLTFLQQCTRQGNTIGASDALGKSANNLAFGQAPYCVLRLGDFYNQLICIDNISIDYEGPTFDLNTEGIGVQPLLAKVSLSFKFIGGGDLAGPVRRLQNAMTFNYYANTGLYDNRADRPLYKENEITGVSTLDTDSSYAYTAQMAKSENNNTK